MQHTLEHGGVVDHGTGTTPVTGRSSFTLIELLVVVAIVLILAGISFRLIGLAADKSAAVNSRRILEQVKHALAEYYTLNGIYPPSDKVIGGSPITFRPIPDSVKQRYPTIDWVSSPGLVYYLSYSPGALRWAHYLEKAVVPTNTIIVDDATFQGGQPVPAFEASDYTIRDGWQREIHYECFGDSKYQSYRLWSDGASTNTSSDDIGMTGTE